MEWRPTPKLIIPSLQWKLTPQFVVKMDTTNWEEWRSWHLQKDHIQTRAPPKQKAESEFGALKLGETPPQPWTHIKPQELTGLQTPSPGSPLPLRWLLFFPRDAHARAIFFLSTSIKPALLSPWCVLETLPREVKDLEVAWYAEVHRELGQGQPRCRGGLVTNIGQRGKVKGTTKYMWHSKLKMRWGTWSFRGERGH